MALKKYWTAKQSGCFISYKATSVNCGPSTREYAVIRLQCDHFIEKTKVDYAASLVGLERGRYKICVTICPNGPFLPPEIGEIARVVRNLKVK